MRAVPSPSLERGLHPHGTWPARRLGPSSSQRAKRHAGVGFSAHPFGVTNTMTLSASISFKSERFDYKSELPEDINAGNRFYGKDVAEYIVEKLSAGNLRADFLDEDWGWLIFSQKDQTPIFEVAVYNLAEHKGATARGLPEWGLWIRAYETRKLLGLLPKRHEVRVPPELLNAIESAVRAAGAVPEPWDDGPSDA